MATVTSPSLVTVGEPAPPTAGSLRVRHRDRMSGWLVTLAVTLLALGLRLAGLAQPQGVIFDEVYYSDDSADLLDAGVELDDKTGNAAYVVHPPLGKWAIAIGQALLGRDEVGWRIAAVVAGTVSVLVLTRVARRMTGSNLLGGFAGLLLALDGLHFVQSRVAMLDIFLSAWLVGAFACLVADRDAARRPGAGAGMRRWRPWLLGAGACLGAAVATKWSALYFLAAFGLLAFAWSAGRRRARGEPAPVRSALWRDGPRLALSLGLLPLSVYLASWTGWFLSDRGWDRHWVEGSGLVGAPVAALRSLWHYHGQVLSFHAGLSSAHPYDSSPWGWLLLARPVLYHYTGIPTGSGGCEAVVSECSRAVLSIGSPAIWWASVPALLATLWLWVSRRDWRAAAVLAGAGAGLLPWLATPERTMFLFYALPALPFLVLALTLTAGWVLGPPGGPRRAAGAAAVTAYAVLVVWQFFYLQPILTAEVIPYAEWRARIWFRSWI